jgi:hypothetical protein
VIELPAGAIILPAIGIVAVIARTSKLDFLKGSAVGIVVTALAPAVCQPFELSGLLTGPRPVALLACLRLMQSRKWEVSVAMLESGRRLKTILRVASQTIGAELALMLILMTGKALTTKSKKRPVRIFQLNLGAGRGWNLGCDVTFLTFLLCMLAHQGKTRLGHVVEVLAVQTDQRRCLALVFLMTTPAIGLASRALEIAPVKPRLSFHPAPDLGVTLQTLEAARAGAKGVTGRTLGQSFQLLVNV